MVFISSLVALGESLQGYRFSWTLRVALCVIRRWGEEGREERTLWREVVRVLAGRRIGCPHCAGPTAVQLVDDTACIELLMDPGAQTSSTLPARKRKCVRQDHCTSPLLSIVQHRTSPVVLFARSSPRLSMHSSHSLLGRKSEERVSALLLPPRRVVRILQRQDSASVSVLCSPSAFARSSGPDC